MKKALIVIIIISIFQNIGKSQIFGNTLYDTDTQTAINFYTWWRVLTGPSDSGDFTHLGVYVNSTNTASSLKMAIYDYNESTELPNELLVNVHLENIIPGVFNEIALPNTISFTSNTYYWVGFKSEEPVGISFQSGAVWPYTTYWYTSIYSAPWPDPAPTGLEGSNATSLGAFYIVGNNMVLPIDLKSINAYIEENFVSIEWETSTEINNSGWNIQRTNNGTSYHTIGWIEGSNNTQGSIKYKFNDKKPKRGLNIYRLEQIDLNGKKSYSKHVTTNFIKHKKAVYPNPAKDFINVKEVEMKEVLIINAIGQTVLKVSLGESKIIDISNLKNGNYRIIDKDSYSSRIYSFIKSN